MMAKLTLIIEDDGDEVKMVGIVDPQLTPDKEMYTPAEVIGLYMQQNMRKIMSDSVKWAREPDQPSLIAIPGGKV
jgi:hypothetical protein